MGFFTNFSILTPISLYEGLKKNTCQLLVVNSLLRESENLLSAQFLKLSKLKDKITQLVHKCASFYNHLENSTCSNSTWSCLTSTNAQRLILPNKISFFKKL